MFRTIMEQLEITPCLLARPTSRAYQMQLAKIDGVERVSKMAPPISKRFISIFKSAGDVPPSPLKRAAARPPMTALLLGSIEAPIKAYSQPARPHGARR